LEVVVDAGHACYFDAMDVMVYALTLLGGDVWKILGKSAARLY